MATYHAGAILDNVVEQYEKQFEDENSYESLLFFFMWSTPHNPETHTITKLRSDLETFRQKYFHQYLHYRQDRQGEPFVKAFQIFDENKDPKKKHYVDFVRSMRNMWVKPLTGGHANGEFIMFSRPDDLIAKWCMDEVHSLVDPKTCQFCMGKKHLVRSLIVPYEDGGTSCPANILCSCRACREVQKQMSKVEYDERLRLMLRIDVSTQETVKKLANLPVRFLQGFYRNPSFDRKASFTSGVQEALGSVTPVLEKCQRELEVVRQICTQVDEEHRECERKLRNTVTEQRQLKQFNHTLKRTIQEREHELRWVYDQLQRANQFGRTNNQNYGQHQQFRGHGSSAYGSIYGNAR